MPPSDRLEGPGDAGTWLVIPYYDGDTGTERPVPPGKAIPYLCRSIIVDGQAGAFTLRRGAPMGVTVDVANWGAGALTALAQVRVWWADPTTVFAKAHPFGQAVVPVPPGGEAVRSGVMRGTIPLSAPPHVCLLAHVSAPLDGAGKTAVPAPALDRRWAQANLTEIVTAGGPVRIPFAAGNPFDRAATARFGLRPLTGTELELMGQMTGRDSRTLSAPLDVTVESPAGDAGAALSLDPGSQVPLTLLATLPQGVTSGTGIHMVLTQTIVPDDHDRQPLEGSLGVRFLAPS